MSEPGHEVILEHVTCPLGCTSSDQVILSGRDLLHDLPGTFTVVKCRGCGLMRTTPRPTPGTIGFYYPDDYGPYLQTRVPDQGRKPASRVNKVAHWIKRRLRPFRRLLDPKTVALPDIPAGRMLEIGCASGAFLRHMADRGWSVQGIEFSETAARAAARLGYPVHAGPLETAPDPDEPFDLIVGWMVLEHLYDPIGGLRKLREWAKPGAWLAVSVPNADSLEFRLFKAKWYSLSLPTHLHHFTPDTLEKVLSISGWSLESIHHQRVVSNLIASSGYVLRDKGYAALGQKLIAYPDKAGYWSYLLAPIAWLLSMFGQTGRMTIWARVAP